MKTRFTRPCLFLALVALLLGTRAADAQVPDNPYSYSRTSTFTYYGPGDGKYNGLLKTETVELAKVQLGVTTGYIYDAYGNKVSATTSNVPGATGDALFSARSTSTAFDSDGLFPVSSTNALLQSETRTFDARFGVVTRLVGPNGEALATSWIVDDFGRKTKEQRADGTSTVIAYCLIDSADPSNSKVTSGDPIDCPIPVAGEAPPDAFSFVHSEPRVGATQIGPFVRVYSDRKGRQIRSVTQSFDGTNQAPGVVGALIVKDTRYNTFGAKVEETQPYFLGKNYSTTDGAGGVGLTRYAYDALGRPTRIEVADEHGSQFSAITVAGTAFGSPRVAVQTVQYLGLKTTTINDKLQKRDEEKNVNGQVVRITDASGAQLAHQHDAFGNLVTTKDALQNTVSISYDYRGRKVSMSDPDTGTWAYAYDALGQLTKQQGPNQTPLTATSMVYDKLGRMTQRSEPEYVSNWVYDSCATGIGKLCASSTSHDVSRTMVYDSLGRPSSTRTVLGADSPVVASAVSYDSKGRVGSQTYPTGLTVNYVYTGALGFLEKVTLGTAATVNPLPSNVGGVPGAPVTLAAGHVLWQANAVNAWGKVEQQVLGNGVTSRATFEGATGRATALTAGLGAATNIVDYQYTWDSLNNLGSRADNIGDGAGAVSEVFTYGDQLNRLTQYNASALAIPSMTRTVDLHYNALGMLLYKSDVGNYSYNVQGGAHPHALQSVAGTVNASYTYDDAGNLTDADSGRYKKIAYTTFNLPNETIGIEGRDGAPRYTWRYDENHQRIKEVRASAGSTRTTWMLHPDNQGGLGFEREESSAGISNRHYLSAGGQLIGVLVSTGALPNLGAALTPPVAASITLAKVEYWHKDHLGSLVATTDHTGAVTARYAYDPFGKRRFTNGSYDAFGTLVVDWTSNTNAGTDRGYTGHEHLDDVGLVHMNGRIFDPTLGVFLQGDPFIQDPGNLQNFNRYGYCYNNPLTCTDPSGQVFGWGHLIVLVYMAWVADQMPEFRPYVAIFAAVVLGPAGGAFEGGAAAYGMSQAATAGFVSGAIASGNLQGALQGAFTAGMFNGAGNLIGGGNFFSGGASDAARLSTEAGIAMHAVVGCVTSAAGGGKCGPGALSAAFSKAFAGEIMSKAGDAGVIASAVIGGTASVLGGGKFASGAMSGAFGYLFNECAHTRDCGREGGYGGEGLKVSAETYRTWGSYVPGTEAGDSAAQYWADRHVQTGNPLYAVPGALASLWTPDTAVGTALTLGTAGGGSTLLQAAGPLKQWIRLGPSYSKAGSFNVDMSIRWGASPAGGGKYIRQIPSTVLQNVNQWFRSQQLPFGGWRSADPGHFHLW